MDGPPDRGPASPPGRGRRGRVLTRRDPCSAAPASSPAISATTTWRRSAWTTARCSRASNGSGRGTANRSGWSGSPMLSKQDSDEYVFPPALLDACLQAVIPADGDFDQRNGGLYLPHEIEAGPTLPPAGPSRVGPRPPAGEDASPVGIGRRHLQRGWPAGGAGARPAQPSRRGGPGGVARRLALRLSVAPPAAIGGGYRRRNTASWLIFADKRRHRRRGSRSSSGLVAMRAPWSTSARLSRTAARDITGSIPAGRKTCCGSSRPSSGPINCRAEASSTCGTSTHRRRTG